MLYTQQLEVALHEMAHRHIARKHGFTVFSVALLGTGSGECVTQGSGSETPTQVIELCLAGIGAQLAYNGQTMTFREADKHLSYQADCNTIKLLLRADKRVSEETVDKALARLTRYFSRKSVMIPLIKESVELVEHKKITYEV